MQGLAFLSKRSKQEKTILFVIVFLIVAAILHVLILRPILSKMKDLDAQIKTEESRTKRNLHILAQKDRIREEIDYFGSYVVPARTQDEETVGFLQKIEEIANKSSLYVIDIKSAGVEAGDLLDKYFVKLNCEALIEQLTNFFYDVESSKKLYKVESFDIRPKTIGSSVIRCAVTISKAVMKE